MEDYLMDLLMGICNNNCPAQYSILDEPAEEILEDYCEKHKANCTDRQKNKRCWQEYIKLKMQREDAQPSVVISQEDFGILAVCSLRYCQGRQTYMPGLVRRICKNHLADFSDNDLNKLINDCDTQAECNLYGDADIDKPGWILWKLTLDEEKRRRENDNTGTD